MPRIWHRCGKDGCNMRVMKEGKLCRRCAPAVPRTYPPVSEETKQRIREKRRRQKQAAGTLATFEGF